MCVGRVFVACVFGRADREHTGRGCHSRVLGTWDPIFVTTCTPGTGGVNISGDNLGTIFVHTTPAGYGIFRPCLGPSVILYSYSTCSVCLSFIVYHFFAYRTLASYCNGLLCHMRALSNVLYRIRSSTVAPTRHPLASPRSRNRRSRRRESAAASNLIFIPPLPHLLTPLVCLRLNSTAPFHGPSRP